LHHKIKQMLPQSLRILISELGEEKEISEAFDAIKEQQKRINIRHCQRYHVSQPVTFIDNKRTRYSGTISNIGSTGRITIKLINSRYSSYAMGAAGLTEAISKVG